MGVLVKSTSKTTKHGGNSLLLVQAKVNTDGTYITPTAADVFGDTAATVQEIGNILESDFRRNDDGTWSLKVKILEQDLIRHNMLELLSPPDIGENEDDEEFMEDNTTKVGSKAASFNSAKPVFAGYYSIAGLSGKKRVRHAFMQAKPGGGHTGQKAKQRNYIEVEFYTIHANGSPAFTAPVHAALTGVTFGALASPYQYGKMYEET